ncbi:MAG: hypothetical protein MHM6MM_003366 [Cercozoa sp. M6MM]
MNWVAFEQNTAARFAATQQRVNDALGNVSQYAAAKAENSLTLAQRARSDASENLSRVRQQEAQLRQLRKDLDDIHRTSIVELRIQMRQHEGEVVGLRNEISHQEQCISNLRQDLVDYFHKEAACVAREEHKRACKEVQLLSRQLSETRREFRQQLQRERNRHEQTQRKVYTQQKQQASLSETIKAEVIQAVSGIFRERLRVELTPIRQTTTELRRRIDQLQKDFDELHTTTRSKVAKMWQSEKQRQELAESLKQRQSLVERQVDAARTEILQEVGKVKREFSEELLHAVQLLKKEFRMPPLLVARQVRRKTHVATVGNRKQQTPRPPPHREDQDSQNSSAEDNLQPNNSDEEKAQARKLANARIRQLRQARKLVPEQVLHEVWQSAKRKIRNDDLGFGEFQISTTPRPQSSNPRVALRQQKMELQYENSETTQRRTPRKLTPKRPLSVNAQTNMQANKLKQLLHSAR